MSGFGRMARLALGLPGFFVLAACQVEIQPSIQHSGDAESQARMGIARSIEALPGFASPSAGSVTKAPFEDAVISGPNYSVMLGGRAFYCIDVTFAGPGPGKTMRHAKAEVLISPTTGQMASTPSSITEERCTGSTPARRFDELLALRQAALGS